MAKTKTAGKVYRRSDRWIENGLTIIGVSGLLTISWRIYTVGKIPFWSAWPGILGVAVVVAGIVVTAVGFGLRDDEGRPGRVDSNGDSNSSDHRQAAATGYSA
jgi:hypothetical protein